MDPVFPTFCHISQHGSRSAYRDLPRMIAMSSPLVLWAPSSAEIRAPTSRISPHEFLTYLDRGDVRIFGRAEWLLDPSLRGSTRWPDSSWDTEIDGEIRSILLEDESKPQGERRVIAAPAERGYAWAERYLDAHPGEVDRWSRIVRSRRAGHLIPSGTLRAVALHLDEPFLVARRILRDAYNHGRAFAESNATAPFLSPSTDRRFIDVLAKAPSLDSDDEVSPAGLPPPLSPFDTRIADLTAQVLNLLKHLDIHSRHQANPKSLERFLRSEGHRELAWWLNSLCGVLMRTNPRIVDNVVLEQLRDDLHRANFVRPLADLLHKKDELSVGIVGLLSTIVGLATDPVSTTTMIGVTASVYPVGKGLSRQLGFAPQTFKGPHWPFLYTYGSRPKRADLERLRLILDEL